MANEPPDIQRSPLQPANPYGEVQHCHECYEKSLDWDLRRTVELAKADAFMRAIEILELDTGKCSGELRDEAERIIRVEFDRQYPKEHRELKVPKF